METRIAWHRVQRLVQLMNEGHEIGARSDACRQHVVDGVARLVGAPVALFVVDTAFRCGGSGPLVATCAHGLEGSLLPAVEAVVRDRCANPVLAAIISRQERPRDVVALDRRAAVRDRDWYASTYFGEYLAPAGYDDLLASARATEVPGFVSGFALVRARHDRPFSREDAALLELLSGESASLMKPDAPAPARSSSTDLGDRHARTGAKRWKLTARETDVLVLVVAGDSNKDIARKLRCSPRTIEIHVSAILRKAGVRTRTQLAATVWRG